MTDQKRTSRRLRVSLPPKHTQETASSSTSTKDKSEPTVSAATGTSDPVAPARAEASACNSPAKDKSPHSDRSGASSPEQNCAICLGKLENKSFTDSCLHMFCFVCLLEWSKVKPVCPLCQQQFKRIIHNVRSIEDFEEYEIPPEQPTWDNPGGARFRYRTTQTHNRLFQRFERNFANMLRPVPATSVTTRSQWRFRRQNATADFRRRVYQNHMWVQPNTTGRVRSTSAEFYVQNPATTHRLIPWLNRELLALLNNQDQVHFLLELIIDLIKRFDIQSQEFLTHIQPYIGDRTEHFIHEFYQFARSPHDMVIYDEHATYNQPEIVDDNTSDSDDSDVMVISQTDILPNVSTLHNYAVPSGEGHRRQVNQGRREPPAERRGGGADFPDITPLLLQDVHNFLSMADSATGGTGRSHRRYGISDEPDTAHSGWESPTPGTSWLAPSQPDFSLLMSDLPLDFSLSRRNSTAAAADNVPTQEVEENDSDLEIIGYEKPKAERTPPTPILISSDSDETIDVVATHKKKKKHKKSSSRHDHRDRHEHVRSRSRSKSRRRHRSRSRSRHSTRENSRRSRSRSRHRPNLLQRQESPRERDKRRHDRLQSWVRPVGIALDIHRKSTVTGKSGHYHWQFSSPGDPRNPEMYSSHRFHSRRRDGRHSSSETSTTEKTLESTRSRHSQSHSSSSQKHSHRRSSASRGSSVEVIENRKRRHKKHKKNKKHKKHKRAKHADDSDGFEIVGEPSEQGQSKSVNRNEEHSAVESSSSGAKCKKHPTGHKSTQKGKSSANIMSQIGASVNVRTESQINHDSASETTSKQCKTASRTGLDSVALDLSCGSSGVQHTTHSPSGDGPVDQSSSDHPLFPIMNSSQDSSLGDDGCDELKENVPNLASPRRVSPPRTITSKWDEPENSDSTICDEPEQYSESERVKSPPSSLVDQSSSHPDANMESERGDTESATKLGYANGDCAENSQASVDSFQDLNSDRLKSVVNFKQTCINELTEKLRGNERLFLNGCSVDSADKGLNKAFDMNVSEKMAVSNAANRDILDSGHSSAHKLTSLSLKFRNGEWQKDKLGEKQNSLENNHATAINSLFECFENPTCATDLLKSTTSPVLKNPSEPNSFEMESRQICEATFENLIASSSQDAFEGARKSVSKSASENSLNVPSRTSQIRVPSEAVASTSIKDYREKNYFQMPNELSDISSADSDSSSQDSAQNDRIQASHSGPVNIVIGKHAGRRPKKDIHKTLEEMNSEDSDSEFTDGSESSLGSSSGVECTSVSVSSKKKKSTRGYSTLTTSNRISGTASEVVTIGDSESEVECTGFVQLTPSRSTVGSAIDVVGIDSSESDSDVEVMSHHINLTKPNHVDTDRLLNFSSDSCSSDSSENSKLDIIVSRMQSDINVTDISASEQGLSPWENVQEPIIDVEIVTSGNETVDSDVTDIDVVNDRSISHVKNGGCETSLSDSDSDQMEIVVDRSSSAKNSPEYKDDSFSAISSPELDFEFSPTNLTKPGNHSNAALDFVGSSKPGSWLSLGQNDCNKTDHAICSSFLASLDSDESLSISVTSEHGPHNVSRDFGEKPSCDRETDESTTETTRNKRQTKDTDNVDTSSSQNESMLSSYSSVSHAEVEDKLVGRASKDLTPISEMLDVGIGGISPLPDSFSVDFPGKITDGDLSGASTDEDQMQTIMATDSSLNSDQFVEEFGGDMNSSSTPLHPDPINFLFDNSSSKDSPLKLDSECDTTVSTSQDQDIQQNNSDGSMSSISRDSEMRTEDSCELQNQSNLTKSANDDETDIGSESCNGDSTLDHAVSEFLLPISEVASDPDLSCISRPDVDKNPVHDSEMTENSCDELKNQSILKENENIASSGDETDLGASSLDGESTSDHAVSDFLLPVNEDVSDSSCSSATEENSGPHDVPDLEDFIEPVLEEPSCSNGY